MKILRLSKEKINEVFEKISNQFDKNNQIDLKGGRLKYNNNGENYIYYYIKNENEEVEFFEFGIKAKGEKKIIEFENGDLKIYKKNNYIN